ncbi:MAG: NAD(P)-binding protein [Chitinivibrionales bacterium]|nr:NAD(P)-binding protein [Chitinivibrionales bacterium]
MRIVIIGGGFAGRAAAHSLRKLGRYHRILLFDRHPYTTMIPALPDFAGGKLEESMLKGTLRKRTPGAISFVNRAVDHINLDSHTVTSGSEHWKYDKLIMACGSKTDFHGFSPSGGTVYPLDSLPASAQIRRDFPAYLQKKGAQSHLIISGGGYNGLELGCSLKRMAEQKGGHCRVTIVEMLDKILAFLPAHLHRHVMAFIDRAGIEVMTGTKIDEYDGAQVTLSNGTQIKDPFMCWTAGTKFAVDNVSAVNASRLKDGRFKVESTLQVKSYPDVYAAGDAAAIKKGSSYLRKAVNFSLYSGSMAGKNCAAELTDNPQKPFYPLDPGWIIPMCKTSVGKIFGIIPVSGVTGLRLHYFMCGYRNYSLFNFLKFGTRFFRPLGM